MWLTLDEQYLLKGKQGLSTALQVVTMGSYYLVYGACGVRVAHLFCKEKAGFDSHRLHVG